jgi:hypothetical protein
MNNEESDKAVRITLDGSGLPVAFPDPVPVKKDKEKVRWFATFPFTIEIRGSNISSSPSGSEHDAKSGVFHDPVNTKIKYSITANGQTKDPDVEILP